MGLDSVEIVMEVEDEFEIGIPDPEAESIRTVGDIASIVMRRLAEQRELPKRRTGEKTWLGVGGVDREAVRMRVREIVAQQMRLDLEEVQPESRLVEDIGVD